MTKIRVYEYAKEINKTSKEVITKLKELNLPVSNHMSTITDEMKEKLEQSFKPKVEEKATKQEKSEKSNHNPQQQSKQNKPNKPNDNKKKTKQKP